jgi:hypothetical protein
MKMAALQFQNRCSSQGAPHQYPKEVAARGMAIAGYDMIVCMGLLRVSV